MTPCVSFWQQCLVASAREALDALDARHPKKYQMFLYTPETTVSLERARVGRSKLLAKQDATLKKVLRYIATEDGKACVALAAQAVRFEVKELAGAHRCIFRDRVEDRCLEITLFSNRNGRTQASYVLSPEWLHVLEAVSVTCNMVEFLDQVVEGWLQEGAVPQTKMTEELMGRLYEDKPLADCERAYKCAGDFLFRTLGQ